MTALVKTSTNHADLGSRLLHLRRSRGLSLRGAAIRLGCHHTLVLRWEQGLREPAVHDLLTIARVFGVEVDAIFERVELGHGRVASSRAHGWKSRERLGARLRDARDRRRLRLWDVFRATGITGRRLRTIEAGADPSLLELQLLAAAYETRVRDLLSNPLDDYGNRPSVTGSTPTDSKMVRQGPTGRQSTRSGRRW